ncbi:hypothetical protein HFP57_00395 [Parasphingopyxis algicola]|uniref:hypothetical protein n=1 Tax=Parasphingopyxis algicola TaxID=2026624 RepID=UPI0015A4C6CB|nr:hypothetical protein [Parasphingopyxis algicola]QLC23636.1 hypothetical protein HFP57_00395 [Parasphingopyxis algicola]
MITNSPPRAEKTGPYPYRPPRTPIVAYVDLFAGGMHLGAIQMRNLSARGLGASGFAFHQRKSLEVRLSGIGQIRARLAWHMGPHFGLEFQDEICVEAFDLGGPSSVFEPLAHGEPGAGWAHCTDHGYPPVAGEGCFVRPNGKVVDS